MRPGTALLLLLLSAQVIADPEVTFTEPVAHGAFAAPRSDLLDDWARRLFKDRSLENESKVGKEIATFLREAKLIDDDGNTYTFDLNRPLTVLFPASGITLDGKPGLVRVLLDPRTGSIGSSNLPGLDRLDEVLISGDEFSVVRSRYSSERVTDPRLGELASIPKIAIQFGLPSTLTNLTNLFGSLQMLRSNTARVMDEVNARGGTPYYLHVNRVGLEPRTSIDIDTRLAGRADRAVEVKAQLRKELARARNREARGVPCSLRFIDTLGTVLERHLDGLPQDRPLTDVARKDLRDAVRVAYDDVVTSEEPCRSATTPAETRQAEAVENRIIGFIASAGTGSVEGKFKYTNIPRQVVSLGLMAGGLISRSGDVRAKVADGKVVEDPLSSNLTILPVYLHVPYDPTAFPPSRAERWRAFVGPVITPELGIAAGLGYSIVRGVTLNVGYSLLRVRTPANANDLNNAPSTPTGKDPLKGGRAHGPLFALGYSF